MANLGSLLLAMTGLETALLIVAVVLALGVVAAVLRSRGVRAERATRRR